MKNELLYFNDLNVLDSDKNSYCVDMLRLKCNISVNDFEKHVGSRLFIYDKFLNKYRSTQINQFYYNYQYVDENCSFWFGFISNKEKNDAGSSLQNANKKYNLTIEFNPNKVKDNKLVLDILKCSSYWNVIIVDFAFDIKTNILNIIGFDKRQKHCLKTYDNGGDDKTYYIGEKNNKVKIYNKKNESGLDYDLTRIEITKYFKNISLKNIRDFSFSGYFPQLFLSGYQITMDDINSDRTLMVHIFALNAGFPIHNMTRNYKKKVIDYMQQKKPIEIDFNCFSVTLLNYLSHYFPFISDF